MKTLLKTFTLSTFYFLLCPLSLILGSYAAFAQANEPGSGNCLEFDGVNDYVDVADNSSIDVTNAATFSAWIYLRSYPSVTSRIFSKWQSNDLSYEVEIGPTGFISIGFSTTGSNVIGGAFVGQMPLNKWTHITFTNNGVNTKGYLNGSATGVGSGGSFYVGTANLEIGGSTFEGRWIDGQIDEVRIWNYARSQTEIREDMCKKLSGSETGLVGYWRLDEGSGSTAFDSSPNTNDGTLY